MLLIELRSYFRARSLEWQGACFLIGWGIMLLLPGATFDGIPSYREMAEFATEDRWGLVFLLAGGVRAAALVINGAWRPCAHIRTLLALLSCGMWLAVFLGLFAAGNQSTGVAVYAIMATSEVAAAYYAAGDAATLDKAAIQRRQKERSRLAVRGRNSHAAAERI